ncbi:hypothetical protein [Limosilactobacillus reuteri]|uniref:hypothetical protein n=1 Tax=Limosilactobacillus reuteri TaxID=1598 RepID=UPI0013B3AB37|nr:hypothetical protein [Limosilactobacillus reuteri]WLR79259.1 hypothetical protein Q3A95_08665 [Limosilactobacillus reuteri]
MDNDVRTFLNLTDPHLNFPHRWPEYKSIKKFGWRKYPVRFLIHRKLVHIMGNILDKFELKG